MEEKEINLLDYIYVLVKWRKLIIINFLVVSILIAIYTLIMPKTFKARAVIMPPTTQTGGLSGLISNLPIGDFGLGGGISDETNSFLAILKSRRLLENVAEKFELMERYGTEDIEETLLVLRQNIGIEIQEEGTVLITASVATPFFPGEEDNDEARNLSADMANFILRELDRINKELETTQARYNRQFIEKRYNQNLRDIETAEQELKEFQEKNDAIALPEQVNAAIEAAADIKAEIIASEVKLGALKATLNPDHPEVQKLNLEVRELRDALSEIKYGKARQDTSFSLFPSFVEAPELGVKLIQLTREMEVQNKLYEFLVQQYEQAKLQEAKDTPTVQVLDSAIPPIKRDKPQRKLTVLIGGSLAIFLSLFAVFSIEFFYRAQKNPAWNRQIEKITTEFKRKSEK
jgi:uncharacterized protein involved in exopolysaccharide biosynthesis